MGKGGGALDGVLVVALEQAVAAPYCTSRLADAGARVIKIERETGDFARGYERAVRGQSGYFVWLNRGKESLVLDIKDRNDAALLERIVARADVFVQNLAPGAAQRAGFGSAALRARYPTLITLDISGYGEDGEYADMKAYDMLVQAESGLCSITGTPEAPGRVGVSICDIACGMYAYTAVLEALYARTRSGEGCAIDLSLFGSIADWMTVPLLAHEHDGQAFERTGLSHPMIQPYGAYDTRDGPPVLIAVQNQREFRQLCEEVLGDPELPDDPRFRDNTARCENSDELTDIITEAFAEVPRKELIENLREARIAFGEVNDLVALEHHPALRRMAVETPGGTVNLVPPPARFDGQPVHPGPVPAIGAHSDAIRQEFAEDE